MRSRSIAAGSDTEMREPKDIKKYIPSLIAGVRLIDLALKYIICRRNVRVKWQLTIWVYYPPDVLKNSKAVAVPTRGIFSSGDFEEEKP
jgi:hypothetical protein